MENYVTKEIFLFWSFDNNFKTTKYLANHGNKS